jgi:threonyl-tRNA synthetase
MKKENHDQLWALRHSAEHVLTQAMLRLYGDKIIMAMGPATDDGFYFDFDVKGGFKISLENFSDIEAEMKKIIDENLPITKEELSVKDAKKLFKDNPYKMEWLEEIEKRGDQPTVFWIGKEFVDLCAGPHAKSTGEINAFKLLKIAGAYWHGDEKNKMLTRIYGTAFESQKELDDYLKMMEEAEKRDHRKIGKELKLFTFSDLVGPGLPLWLPNGTVMAEELEKFAKEMESAAGYLRVKTPHIAKEEMYKISGHLPYYAESMFPPMVLKEENGVETTYYLKAMNCPHHHQIFGHEPRSYRDLPMRLAEYGTCYRYEKSGELFGLMRVRSLSMNDAHIYCTEEQFAAEFKAVNEMYLNYFKIFGIEKYVMRFSTHVKEGLGKKYVDEPKLWKKTEDLVRKVMAESGVNFVEVENEAAFYGPKIDVQVWSSIGKEFTLATNQVDFAVPKRFGLTYIDKDGQEKTPLCIHRAPLGTHERFIGFLIEHYAGNFPLWLSPVQVAVLSVAEKHAEHCEKLAQEFKNAGLRAEVWAENETVGNKIRKAVAQKIPYLIVIGDKEIDSEKLAVRLRGEKETKEFDKKEFIAHAKKLVEERSEKL